MSRVHIVTLRAPSPNGTGDAMRAHNMLAALTELGVDVTVSSVVQPDESLRGHLWRARTLARAARLLLREWRRMPVQVIATRSLMSGANPPDDALIVYVTSRVADPATERPFVIDFVDSLAAHARLRDGRRLSRLFWSREARLLEEWEHTIATKAALGLAVSQHEANLIGPRVKPWPIAIESTAPRSVEQTAGPATVVFGGSLFYEPNVEAALWILEHVVPELGTRGWSPSQVVLAGRSPRPELVRMAERAGVTLKADVADLNALFSSATVSLAPIRLGSGVQTKVINSLNVGTPVLMTPRANQGLGLVPGPLVHILPRDAGAWAERIDEIARSAKPPMSEDIAALIDSCEPANVRSAFRELITPLLARGRP